MMLTMLLKDKADKTRAMLDLKRLLRTALVSAGGPGAPNETGWSSRGGHNESCG